MKKIISICLILLILLSNTGCFKKDEGDIDIENIYDNFVNGYITSSYEVKHTEHFTFNIDANVYVPGYLLEYVEVIYDVMETVSGLSFYNQHYNNSKIVVEVSQNNNANESEFSPAYAHSKSPIAHISSGDLLLGNSYALVHELSHVLQYANSLWSYNNVYTEGFAEYNSYKVVKYLEENNMYVAKAIESSSSQIANTQIEGNIYSQTIEYWLQNPNKTYDISFNGAYSVGMRFMHYLDYEYDNYTDWILYYEQKNPYYLEPFANQEVDMNEQFNAMKEAYNQEIFDGFYDWLLVNEGWLYENPFGEKTPTYDLTSMDYTYVYPYFNDKGNKTVATRFYKFSYDNLYVVIDEVRNYLSEYKNKKVNNLKLKLSDEIRVKLYNANNKLIKDEEGKEFSLEGVSYIKLSGKGTLGKKGKYGLEIVY